MDEQRALHSPAALADFRAGPGLLPPIASRASATHPPPVGYRTCSNTDSWGTHWLAPQLGFSPSWGTSWLAPQLEFSPHLDSAAPRAYLIALQHVAMTLDSDPAWQRWWRHSGVPECDLGIVAEGRLHHLHHLRPRADIRKAGDQVRANFTCAVPSTDRRAAELITPAVTEVTGMFEVIREAIGLPSLPPVPSLPELPSEAHDVEVTTGPLPAEQPEVDQQGYLTLAQIQEFFG